MFDFLQTIIAFLHKEEISYMLSGSVALSIYTLPRSTRDFDLIVNLKDSDIEKLAAAFSEGYYCDTDSIKDAIERKGMFNIIDHATGFKADFIILKDEPFRQQEFKRKEKADFLGIPLYVVSAEDLLISKIIWIQDIQSGIQMEDIKQLKSIEGLDWEYINKWITYLDLNTFDLL